MSRWVESRYLIPVIFLIGILQYASTAFSTVSAGDIALWQLDQEALQSSGLSRYLKDAFVLTLSLAWVVWYVRVGGGSGLRRGVVYMYFVWLMLVLGMGLIPFILELSPLSFLPAGMRWLLLLHAAMGVFILAIRLPSRPDWHGRIFYILLVLVLVNIFMVWQQFGYVASGWGMRLGQSRLTGLFSNAGVASFFAIGMALTVAQLDALSYRSRLIFCLVCVFLALSTGTRFATFSVALVFAVLVYEAAGRQKGAMSVLARLGMIFGAPVIAYTGYRSLIDMVGRGDAFSQQFDEGGRVANFMKALDMLYSSSLDEFFFGRGLGIGTNTAIAQNLANGIDPYSYRYNILVDNAFLTAFFQFGFLGSLLFWGGIACFFMHIRPRHSMVAFRRFLCVLAIFGLVLIAGSPFEHYFLMMTFAISLGAVYGKDRREQFTTGAAR